MTFENWYEELPYDEKAALCKYDVWVGAVRTAIEKLEEEHETLIRQKLSSHAVGVSGCIKILEKMEDNRT